MTLTDDIVRIAYASRQLATEQAFDAMILGFEAVKKTPGTLQMMSPDDVIDLLKQAREIAVKKVGVPA